jgi:hypothetical protein
MTSTPHAALRVARQQPERRAADALDDIDQRERSGDHQALEHAEGEDAGQGKDGEHDRAAPESGEAHQRRDVVEARDRDHDDRGQGRLGKVLEQRCEKRAGQEHQAGADQRGELGAPARSVCRGGLAGAPRLHEPGGEPG